jgi:hypothetical protein
MPFVLYERGFELDPGIEKQLLKTEPDLPARREAWKRDRTSVSDSVVGDR